MTHGNRRPALGRGLSALIGDAAAPAASGHTAEIPLDRIRPARHQPRNQFDEAPLAELVESIREHGVLQPIVVRPDGPDHYVLIAGERRWRASRLAGLSRVPAVVRDVAPDEAYELALVENIQREDLGPLEEASAYAHLLELRGLTQEALARRVGKDRATIANALRLLKLPSEVQTLVNAGTLTAGHSRALLVAPSTDDQIALAHRAVEDGWSVRELERRARHSRDATPREEDEAVTPPRSPATEAVEAQLRQALGAPVQLRHRAGKGRIEIRFHSIEELERLLEMLSSLEGR